MQKQKKHTGLIIVLSILAVLIITVVGTAGVLADSGQATVPTL